jgi:phosphate transport system substrate-binding protein
VAGCAFALGFLGCSPQPKPRGTEESLTSGRISVVCAPEAQRLIARERAAFQALYPQASLDVRPGTSRDAVAALYGATCDLAVITRELTVEERSAAQKGGLELEGYRFARDAIVAVVNPRNKVENLGLDQLAAIYRGEATRWSEFGGSASTIVPVIQPFDSDLTHAFLSAVMSDSTIRARVLTAADDSAVVDVVSRTPDAIGYVTLPWADRGARAVRIASVAGLRYWAPDGEAIYHDQYPLIRFYNFYVRGGGKPLANGFITYVTSRDGQALVHDEGLVPTTVPVRFVRRSPMLGSH